MSMATKKTWREYDKEVTRIKLREMLKPGDTLYTSLNHVSRSGMSREIGLYVGSGDAIQRLTHDAAEAVELKVGKHDGVKMGGWGMDMGFSLVYSLGRSLYPAGFQCAGEACQSNDHFNDSAIKRDGSHHHKDGGYAFRQDWL